MNKKIISMLITIPLYNCGSTPKAPIQPENGVIKNYNSKRPVLKGLVKNAQRLNKFSDGTVSISNIPFFTQGSDNTCGQASMTSILNYWGDKVDYQTVINESNPQNLPTSLETIESYLDSKGLKATPYKKSTMEYLKYLVNQG
jgi:hypothetical protein